LNDRCDSGVGVLEDVRVKTRRGKDVLIHSNRAYRQEKCRKSPRVNSKGDVATVYWVCANSCPCKGRLKQCFHYNSEINSCIGDPWYVTNEASHTCIPDAGDIARRRASAYVDARVLHSDVGIVSAVGEASSLIRDEMSERLPNFSLHFPVVED
jgi:hypothetical protein